MQWKLFHESLEKAKRVLERNQYSPAFYEPLIREALASLVEERGSERFTEPPENDSASVQVEK